MSNLLQVNRVNYTYDKGPVLKDVSFSLEQGEFLGIIGPNGAGKSTLLKTINRILLIKKGQILLRGTNLTALPSREIARRVSLVGQDINISFSLTVLDLVLMGRFPHLGRFEKETRQDIEIVQKCLHLTQTLELSDRQFNQLSAGERQRVVLAKALAQQPELLLLDEPTAHLDIAHQIKIFDLLDQLNREKGLSIIVVLHDLNLASEYCQKLILLNRGEIMSQGDCQEVLQYATIEKTYATCVLVKQNPLSQKPYILPVPGKYARPN